MVSPIISRLHPELDPQQMEVIAHGDGPLQVVAGPGSGKTTCIADRAANLVLTDRAKPHELALCTFTREAAREMRNRFTATLRASGHSGDLSRVMVSTIHSLCHRLLTQYGNAIGLRPGYRLLNTADQLDLMETNYDHIFGPDHAVLARGNDRWTDPERAVVEARRYFDRISDDLIDHRRLIASGLPFPAALGRCHQRYGQLLWERRAVDFAHLQTWALALLDNPQVRADASARMRHLLVDEYQDTSFAQERLLRRLASAHGNICVVGDDDQAIYRFRGARVDNMTRFRARLPGCRLLYLTNNYRSHRRIVAAFNHWMASGDWSNPRGVDHRFDKTIAPRAAHASDDHPAVVSIMGTDRRDEAGQLAAMLVSLRGRGFITDYNQAVVLLPSVKWRHSQPYVDAFRSAGIPVHLVAGRDGPDADETVSGKQQPQDHVLLTTIHQAKGREWPVVAVGLPRRFRQWPDRLDRDLGQFRPEPDGEPPDRVDEFDLRRQYYVAFSRARRLLALTASHPDPAFLPALAGAPVWTDVSLNLFPGNAAHTQPVPASGGHNTDITHLGPLGLAVAAGGGVRIILGGDMSSV